MGQDLSRSDCAPRDREKRSDRGAWDVSGHGFTDASGYEAWFTSPIGAFVDHLECGSLLRAVTDMAPGAIVDIGAGTGHFARVLADRHHIIAVEPSQAMRDEGRRRGAGLPIRWCAGVGEHLPLEQSSLNGALVMATLEWVEDPQGCVDEALRVLRPGGWLVVGFLTALSPWAARYHRRADQGAEPWKSARFFTRADIVQLVGVEPDSVEGVVHLAPEAAEPWTAADNAGRRAGNQPAMEVLQWILTR
jgi:SAM-dependent methyltransferase